MSGAGSSIGDVASVADAPFGSCPDCGTRLSVMGAADDPLPGYPFRKRIALRCMACGRETTRHVDPPV